MIITVSWEQLWAHQDSNLEPTDYESGALTVELWALQYYKVKIYFSARLLFSSILFYRILFYNIFHVFALLFYQEMTQQELI